MHEFLLAFVLATIVSNFAEWFTHKYILHGLGKKKNSFFHYHWVHHHACRKNDNVDTIYVNWYKSKDVWKEFGSLCAIALFNLNWLFIWPMFFYCILFWIVAYFVLHAVSHSFPGFISGKFMPWHRDHHMGKNQDMNWCVTFPLADYVMGTRKKYGA